MKVLIINLVLSFLCITGSYEHINRLSGKIFEFFPMHMIQSDDMLRNIIFNCLKNFISKIGDYKSILDPLLINYLPSLDYEDCDNNEDYLEKLNIFSMLIKLRSDKIDYYLTPKLIRKPFSNFQLDIFTNNAEIFSEKVYNHVDYDNLLTVLYSECLKEQNKEKIAAYIDTMSILAYNFKTPEQIEKLLWEFVKETKLRDEKKVLVSLSLLTNFVEHMDLNEIDIEFIETLIGCFTPHLFSQNLNYLEKIIPAIRAVLNPENAGNFEAFAQFLNFFKTCIETSSGPINVFNYKNGFLF